MRMWIDALKAGLERHHDRRDVGLLGLDPVAAGGTLELLTRAGQR